AFTALVAACDRYLDLPTYDPVRALGDDYRIRGPEAEILMLRWFDKQYGDKVGDQIVRSHLVDKFGKAADIITVLDSRSPQLVEQRLYAAIRRPPRLFVRARGAAGGERAPADLHHL